MVTVFFQHFGYCDTVPVQIAFIPLYSPIIRTLLVRIRKRVFGHLPNTCLVLVQACHQTCTCRTRTGSIIKLSKTYTFRRQRINIGSKYFATITTDIGITHIIYQNQYDIRFLLCGTK